MKRRQLLLFVSLAAALPWAVAARDATAGDAPGFVVIIHPQNPYATLDRSFLADAFLKKTTRWPNGDVIKPVDLPGDSPARERFSNDVIKRSVSAVKSYWQQIIFSGRDVPPPELSAEDDVVKYVLAHPTAVGYVSRSARLGDARAVTIRQ
jgi:ABC-type phosphate transport system substrate-binding protein